MGKIRYLILIPAILLLSSQNMNAAQNIGALGRIFPGRGIINLAGPPGETIEEILVKPGDQVSASSLLVTFASRKMRNLDVEMANSNIKQIERKSAKAVEIQELQIENIKERSNQLIALQKTQVSFAQENLNYATSSLNRLLNAGEGSFSVQQKEEREHQQKVAQISLNIAGHELKQLSSTRDSDLGLARLTLSRLKMDKEISLEKAEEQLKTATENLSTSTLKAPSSGIVLDILQKKGEKCTGAPIIRMADLSVMTVTAEVFQADILKITKGMKANITSKSLPESLTGTISSISRIISDPSKVANVTIVLDDPKVAARLINLEVEVSILLDK